MTTQEQVSAPSKAVAPDSVNHLVLNVKDMERAHTFYTRILGFSQVGEITPSPERPRFWMRFYQGATGSHHDLALAQVPDPASVGEDVASTITAGRPGINHVAIKWTSRDAWLQQVAWMQSQDVRFQSRVDHGMTHSVYVTDPDGHGIEVLYELPREIWEGDINAALNYAKRLPSEGEAALEDDTNYKRFSSQ